MATSCKHFSRQRDGTIGGYAVEIFFGPATVAQSNGKGGMLTAYEEWRPRI